MPAPGGANGCDFGSRGAGAYADTDRFLSSIRESASSRRLDAHFDPEHQQHAQSDYRALGAYPTGLEFRNIIHHVRLYNPTVRKQHLSELGFRDIRIRGVSFLPMSSRFGAGRISQALADALPQLCNNIIAVARRPA